MSNNPNARKIRARLEQITQIQRECIGIFIEPGTCFDTAREKKEMVNLAVSYFEAKLKRTKSKRASSANAPTIKLEIAIQKFKDAPRGVLGHEERYSAGRRVITMLLEMSDAELNSVSYEIKESAFAIAKKHLAEL